MKKLIIKYVYTYGLIEPDEEDIVEEAQVEETSDELVLDLDSTIEIEE